MSKCGYGSVSYEGHDEGDDDDDNNDDNGSKLIGLFLGDPLPGAESFESIESVGSLPVESVVVPRGLPWPPVPSRAEQRSLSIRGPPSPPDPWPPVAL